jgi:hypothetical protein
MNLIKSKKRVADHGEVFTPAWLVEKMLDLVKGETERIDARFLEPACSSGNFLVPILQRKLAAVELKFGRSNFDKRHYALLSLMCCYGIELLADNIAECRENTLQDVITKLEPDLFLAVTGLTVSDFNLLVRLKVFNTERMNQAVFAFRRYEDASLRYTGIESHKDLSQYELYDTVVAKE